MTALTSQLHFPSWVDMDRWNRHQQPVFEEVCARFDEGNRLVALDNPCGGGKSLLGYMVRQYLDVTGYYLVGTKNLQDQTERSFDDIPLIKGRANYWPQSHDGNSHWSQPTCADCDWDSQTELCSYCDHPPACSYSVARSVAAADDFPCANYSYALGEWTSPKSRFRDRGLVVCDEADTIVDELLSFVSVSISPKMQARLGLRPPDRKTVESAWPAWFEYAIPTIKSYRSTIRGDSLENKRRRQSLDRLIEKMDAIAGDLEGWVYEYANDYIEFKPVLVDKLANEYLWRHGQRFLCMSASIGSPEQFVSDLGFEDSWAPVFAPSTFPVENRPLYLCPSARMTKKTEVEEWPKMGAALIGVLSMYPDSRVLVHTHSYGLTKAMMDACDEIDDRTVLAYLNSEEKARVIETFEATDDAVLLAPSLDRGYDNSDIDVVVICKVPSPYLGSKQVNKRLRETAGGELWYANETSKKIVQMYGRACRSETDKGVTIVLDSMFNSFYGKWKRLFSRYVTDAVEENSEVRFRLRTVMRERAGSS